MSNIGIKVVNAGTSIQSNDPRDIIMSSKYSMFKYHSDSTVTLTINAGDSNVYGTISHNLGYVPAFICYQNTIGDPYGYQAMVPNQSYYQSQYQDSSAKMGTQNLVVGYHFLTQPYNQVKFPPTASYWELGDDTVHCVVGNVGGIGCSSATRFNSITLNNSQSIVSAQLEWINNFSGTTNQNTKFITYGIDEDNVQSVDTSKPKTSANTVQEQPKTSGFFNFSTDVTSQVQEIISRAGWSNGNNMGFILENNSSPTDAYIGGASLDFSYVILTIQLPGSTSVTFRGIIFKDKIV